MKPSKSFLSFHYSLFQNKERVQYRVIYYKEMELLLFPNNMVFAQNLLVDDYTSGKLLCSEIINGITELNGEEVIEYYERGVWKKIYNSEFYEFKIFGEGVFSVGFEKSNANFRELQPENNLEKIVLETIKSQKSPEKKWKIQKSTFHDL